MYSRHSSGRRETPGLSAHPIPPPNYGGTLYIGRRSSPVRATPQMPQQPITHSPTDAAEPCAAREAPPPADTRQTAAPIHHLPFDSPHADHRPPENTAYGSPANRGGTTEWNTEDTDTDASDIPPNPARRPMESLLHGFTWPSDLTQDDILLIALLILLLTEGQHTEKGTDEVLIIFLAMLLMMPHGSKS